MYKSHQCLLHMLKEIASDNDMSMKRNFEWPACSAKLEAIASKMTNNEMSTMAIGEWSEAMKVAADHHAEELHDFLDRAFDGDLHDVFFENKDVNKG